MSFKIPWVDGRDVEYLGRGRYRVECIYLSGRRFISNCKVVLK